MKSIRLLFGGLALAWAKKRRSTLQDKAQVIAKKLFPSTDRSNNILMFAVKDIDGYGCWCRIEKNSHGTGKGMPVDTYDKFCRTYHKGVECLVNDYGQSCNPWEIDYNMKIQASDKYIDCNGNVDPCSVALCTVETNFIMSFLTERAKFQAEPLQHEVFNPKSPTYMFGWTDEQCSPNPGPNVDFETQCCGDYPERKPFRYETWNTNEDGTTQTVSQRRCCGDKTYDPYSKDCCDHEIVDIGGICV